MRDEPERKEKPLLQKFKEDLFTLMQNVLQDSEIGLARYGTTKFVEFLIVLSYTFHNRVHLPPPL